MLFSRCRTVSRNQPDSDYPMRAAPAVATCDSPGAWGAVFCWLPLSVRPEQTTQGWRPRHLASDGDTSPGHPVSPGLFIVGCRLAVIDSQSFCGLIVAVSAATPRADAGARKPTRPGQ